MRDKDKEAFEAWVELPSPYTYESNVTTLELMWHAWQAALTHSTNKDAKIERLKRDVRKALFPNGLKHPQLQTWEWILEHIKSLAAAQQEG